MGGQAQGFQQGVQAGGGAHPGQAAVLAHAGNHRHAQGHGFPVAQPAVSLDGFHRVAQGVAKVEDHAQAGVVLVLLHHGGLGPQAMVQDGVHVLHEGLPAPGGAVLQEGKEGLVPDAAVLDHLPQAVPPDLIAEGAQGVRVQDHQPGLIESPHQVFALGQVHGHLAPHGGIHLGQQGGGHLHKGHAPQKGSRRQPGQVAHDPAAQGDYRVPAGEPRLAQEVIDLAQGGQGFGGFPGGEGEGGAGQARALEALLQPAQVQRAHLIVGDNGAAAGAQGLHHQRPGPVQDAGGHVDGVAALPQVNGQCAHDDALLSACSGKVKFPGPRPPQWCGCPP